MDADRRVDMHTHSTASDGFLEPADLVAAAHDAGLAAIGLTDHDTTAGLGAAQAAADRLGIRVIPGVELSARHRDDEAHILGYFIDPASGALQEELRHYREVRLARMEQMVVKLVEIGKPVDIVRVREIAGAGAVGRPHLARAMVEAGHVADMREAFYRYLSYGRPAYVPKPDLEPAEAIAVIRAAGGVPVLAHPFSTGDASEILPRLVSEGLLGMEVWYGEYTPAQRGELHSLATGFGLIPTGGSDFHGPNFKPGRDLGGPPVPYSVVEALADAANAVRAGR
jgi:3',5'-nucleoside bisphosphate phosphatase